MSYPYIPPDPFADTITGFAAPGLMYAAGVVYVTAALAARFQSPLPDRFIICKEPWLSFENRRKQRGEWWDRG